MGIMCLPAACAARESLVGDNLVQRHLNNNTAVVFELACGQVQAVQGLCGLGTHIALGVPRHALGAGVCTYSVE